MTAKKFPHVVRWYMTCSHIPVFEAVLGVPNMALAGTAPSVAKVPVATAGSEKEKAVKTTANNGAKIAASSISNAPAATAPTPVPVAGTPALELRFQRERTKVSVRRP